MSDQSIDGFYAGYFAGKAGNGLALLTLTNGKVVGVDAAGTKFDGRYELHGDTGALALDVHVSAPPGITLVQGESTGEQGLDYQLETRIEASALNGAVVRIETPIGPLNMRLQKLRNQH